MKNADIANGLNLTSDLLELTDDNPFKIKSLRNAAFKIDKMEVSLAKLSELELQQLEGIGKSIAQKIHEFVTTGTCAELHELLQKIPAGVVSMLQIKGIGPKKVAALWRELHIESLGELLYACNENRLVELKGFGAKTQLALKKSIEFTLANNGKLRYPEAFSLANQLLESLRKLYPEHRFEITGNLRRHDEIVSCIEIITDKEVIDTSAYAKAIGIELKIYHYPKQNFAAQWFKTSASKEFINTIQARAGIFDHVANEQEIFELAGLPFVPTCLRDNHTLLQSNTHEILKELIDESDFSGIFHVHTKYSDGAASVKDMALAVKQMGMHYIGITDHSKSAFYAGGLSIDKIMEQHAEIDALNKQLYPFTILKGIESDILVDGQLDYDDEVLASFDFVIASVHSVLKMDQEKATHRLLKAIENPYTTMLGHMTGRLLLAREGYPLDTHRIIDACAHYGVVIELNANPYRLDIDYRFLDYCIKKDVMIAINPDAHSMEGLKDTYYGMMAARKGLLPKAKCFNALSPNKVFERLAHRKSKIQKNMND